MYTPFSYLDGDVVKVERNGDELLWTNERTQKKFSMKAKLKAKEWAEARFCVFIASSAL
jgi:hypothetical protein